MRKSLGEAEWVAAALAALAEEGVAAVAIEPLARRLGVTKGSFYWHFKDRAALLLKTLEEWERQATLEVIATLDSKPPQERLYSLMYSAFNPAADRQYLALASSITDPVVSDVLHRVSKRRLEYLQLCFQELGFPAPEAARRAHLTLAAYVGSKHLTLELGGGLPEGYARQCVDTLLHTLPY
jgi:AcrR family transcriptional regulator